MKCVSCNKEIKDNAKFCNHCGAAQTQSNTPDTKTCPKCGATVVATANFCRSCGSQLSASIEQTQNTGDNINAQYKDANVANNDINVLMTNQHVTWKILPGQLAVKIDEQEMASYKRIKGVYVAPGTIALLFVNGKYTATLESGSYAFDDYPDEDATQSNGVVSFLKKCFHHSVNWLADKTNLFERSNIDAFGNKVFYSVVLIKGSEFPLLYDLENVFTKNIRCAIGLHLLGKITNFNDFFNNQLADKKFVAIETFSQSLESLVITVANHVLASADPNNITHNQSLSDSMLAALQEKISSVYPFINITQIISLTSSNKDLAEIRALKEKLYISELKLEQMQAENTFKNKLQNEENRALLLAARSQADFEALILKLDEEKALTKDAHAKFVLMLNAERELREAKTKVETDAAIRKLVQADWLSQEELKTLEMQIKQRFAIAELDNDHALKLKMLQNEGEISSEKLNWEMAIGNKRLDWEIATGNKILENQIWQQQQQDQYELGKAKNVANFQDERWEKDFDHKQREQAHKMELLKQASEMRRQREEEEHKRKMAEKGQDYQHELDIQKANYLHDIETKRITATMSAEQLLAMTPEGAAAFSEKFKAEAKAKEDSIALELMQQHNAQISELSRQQAADMKEIAMASINATTRIQEGKIADKERENERIHADAERHQDRMLESVTTTVSAVSGIKPNTLTIASTPAPMPPSVFCTNCGKSADSKAMICPHCGNTLK